MHGPPPHLRHERDSPSRRRSRSRERAARPPAPWLPRALDRLAKTARAARRRRLPRAGSGPAGLQPERQTTAGLRLQPRHPGVGRRGADRPGRSRQGPCRRARLGRPRRLVAGGETPAAVGAAGPAQRSPSEGHAARPPEEPAAEEAEAPTSSSTNSPGFPSAPSAATTSPTPPRPCRPPAAAAPSATPTSTSTARPGPSPEPSAP